MHYKHLSILFFILWSFNCSSQIVNDTIGKFKSQNDTLKINEFKEIVVSATRIQQSILLSPLSMEVIHANEVSKIGSISVFDALENVRGVQIITPSLGFKVVNTRGFSNTTNVRFAQLVDGIDNQAPHIGAPIANLFGANDLDIARIEIIPGTASALYGMNALNGIANIHTKNPFDFPGVSIQQSTGVNYIEKNEHFNPQLFSQTNFRYAKILSNSIAIKLNASYINGTDWAADDRTDLAADINQSTGLLNDENPAMDEVNSYGNESPNRRTLTLGGKSYVVARTGYREDEIDNYGLNNFKGDLGVYVRLKKNQKLMISYKGAHINTIYQRSNRFRLQNYVLQQGVIEYSNPFIEFKSYFTHENSGNSYNLRSLAENMDRAFKSDDKWFSDYSNTFNEKISAGASVNEAHKLARIQSDQGRFIPGSDAFTSKMNELTQINDWNIGAALKVNSMLTHTEGVISWHKLFPILVKKLKLELISGLDERSYIIVPDGNYFINPVDSAKNLIYSKIGGFTQFSKNMFDKKLIIGGVLRIEKSDYYSPKINSQLSIVYSPGKLIHLRSSFQSGYRFPSIFEGFSNINSGGVKRIGGLPVMSDGIFENSYTKSSIQSFQTAVLNDMNLLGSSKSEAIEKNKNLLQKNPYTYLQPEHVNAYEVGVRSYLFNKKLYVDFDAYLSIYDNFIAQIEANIPKTTISDSIPYYLYSNKTQNKYRLWTNSKSKVYNLGSSIGLRFKFNNHITLIGNLTYAKLYKIDDQDGLEDGFNTPTIQLNSTLLLENIWKKLGASIAGKYQSNYNYVSFLVSGNVPSYCAFDAAVFYTFEMKQSITTKLGATNLTNHAYRSILGGPTIQGFYYLSVTINIH